LGLTLLSDPSKFGSDMFLLLLLLLLF
jgi:hypothetical protein